MHELTTHHARRDKVIAVSRHVRREIERGALRAHRWQHIVCGALNPRVQQVLFLMLDLAQGARLQAALAPLSHAVP